MYKFLPDATCGIGNIYCQWTILSVGYAQMCNSKTEGKRGRDFPVYVKFVSICSSRFGVTVL